MELLPLIARSAVLGLPVSLHELQSRDRSVVSKYIPLNTKLIPAEAGWKTVLRLSVNVLLVDLICQDHKLLLGGKVNQHHLELTPLHITHPSHRFFLWQAC